MIDTPDDKRDFFISFNQADRAWATWIAWTLEAAGYSVFFQDWDFKGNFVLEMDKAHTQSRRSVAVLSPTYLTSRFAAPEWTARFAQDATSEHDLLILVRVRPCELKGLLAQIVYVDLVGCSEDVARRKLIKRVEGIRLKPDEPPLFPGEIDHTAVPERPVFPAVTPASERGLLHDPQTPRASGWPYRQGLMAASWQFLSDKNNREILALLGGGAIVIAGGIWTVVTFFWSDNGPSSKPEVSVETRHDGVVASGNVTSETINGGGQPLATHPKKPLPPPSPQEDLSLAKTTFDIPDQTAFAGGRFWINIREMSVNDERACKGLAANNSNRFSVIIRDSNLGDPGRKRVDFPCLQASMEAEKFSFGEHVFVLRVHNLNSKPPRKVTLEIHHIRG
ncbi:MAG: toll/interleukin-1 receptor domain-containing protein [Gemmataceae bacterium]